MYKYPVYQPSLNGNEKKYVNECLDSSWISSKGKFISEFEKKFAEFIGIKNAVCVTNGTVAIHLALETLGIKKGDEVIVPTFTYIASVNPIVMTGAKPVFIDSLPDTWQLDTRDLERKITPKTKAVIAVHLYGMMCDMDAVMKIAKKHNLYVIEDCAEAIGSRYKGKHAGTFGDISTFSFFGNKTITCGEGGMVVSNNDALTKRAAKLKGQGLAGTKEYWHDEIGYNYRMTNIAAAIGLAQLEQADQFIAKKRVIAGWYKDFLKGLPLWFHDGAPHVFHSYWMCSILTESEEERAKLREYMKHEGIETRPTFYPAHTMPMYYKKGRCFETAEDISLRGINLPSYPALNRRDVQNICGVIRKFYESR
ncbi:MAG: DegT/DnrJ/EryC1/StrS family aminotransferase [Elusimicrobia bacterium]|nr:DegT/DnrJ/EryC1/StrS family aminotransferase [Elusimicrobiota bacterium]